MLKMLKVCGHIGSRSKRDTLGKARDAECKRIQEKTVLREIPGQRWNCIMCANTLGNNSKRGAWGKLKIILSDVLGRAGDAE